MQRQYVLLCLYYCYMIIIFVNVNTHVCVCLFLIKRVVITCMIFTVCWPVVTVATVNNVITWQEHVPKAAYKDMTVTNVTLVIHFFFFLQSLLVVCFRSCSYYNFFFFLGLKITYVTAKDQLGIAFYGLLTPLIVSVMCNVWCLIR